MTLAHLQQVIDTRSIEEVWALHTAKMASYGFPRLLYAFTRFRTSNSWGDPQDALVLTNHDPCYFEGFRNGGHFLNAPMLRWSAENSGACSWRWAKEQRAAGTLRPQEEAVLAYNARHQVTAGYSISFNDLSERAKGGIGLAGAVGVDQDALDAIWAQHGAEIEVINNVTHLKITHLPHAGGRRALTRRQREALEWVASGKTVQDTADIMALTPATVEKHLRLAREVLDADTTAQAVLKASVQNQFFRL